jgi:hypothetical protein
MLSNAIRKLLFKMNSLLRVLVLSLWFVAGLAHAQGTAPGFDKLRADAKVLIMPSDIEMFTVGLGSVLEPKADWTKEAHQHFRAALLAKKKAFKVPLIEADEGQINDLAEIIGLHAAVSSAIELHHNGRRESRLPTKKGYMDWSMGDVVRVVKEKTGADYALFTFVRDTTATGGLKVASGALTVVGSAFGIVTLISGVQIGCASLVDLETGQIVWFNSFRSRRGDLRDAEKAARTLEWLLDDFPLTN